MSTKPKKRKNIPKTESKVTKEADTKAASKPTKEDVVGEQGSGIIFSFRKLLCFLFEKEDASFLVVWRILWGLIMVYEIATFCFNGWAKMYYQFYNSNFQFKYYLFEWTFVPEDPFYMKMLLVILLICGICITIGFFYRTASIIYFLLFVYLYSLEYAVYLNHLYLVCVINFLMIFLPCEVYLSVDAYLNPKIKSRTVPKLVLWVVRILLCVVYTYAGIVKMNEDWLRAEPLRQWLVKDWKFALGKFLQMESTAYAMSYTGMIYDLFVGLTLLWRKTLWFGIFCTFFFHGTNKILMNIGIFPWMMMASTFFFFDGDWPRWWLHQLSNLNNPKAKPYKPLPGLGKWSKTKVRPLTTREKIILLGTVIFLAEQVIMPTRPYWYPGTTAWNEYGHKFSWRMKLRTKKCFSHIYGYNSKFPEEVIFYIDHLHLIPRKFANKMSGRPDMLVQFAHYLGDLFAHVDPKTKERHRAEIHVFSYCELNGRPLQRLTDPTYDLAAADKWTFPYPWVTEILPLTEKEKELYPWKWEWNFNWLRGKDKWNWDIKRLTEVYNKREQNRFMKKEESGHEIIEIMAKKHPELRNYNKPIINAFNTEKEQQEQQRRINESKRRQQQKRSGPKRGQKAY